MQISYITALKRKFAATVLLWTIGIALNVYAEQLAKAVPPPVAAFLILLIASMIALCWPLVLHEAARRWRIERRRANKALIFFIAVVYTTIGVAIAAAGLMGNDLLLGDKAGGFDTIGLMVGGAISAGLWVWHALAARDVGDLTRHARHTSQGYPRQL